MSWVESLSIVVVAVITIAGFIWVVESRDARKRRTTRESTDHAEPDTGTGKSDSWVITPEEVREATPPASAHRDPPPPTPDPKYRIRYQPHLGSWAVYKWLPERAYYYGYGIRYPVEGRWVLQTRVPTWQHAINLITPNPATERGSSHRKEEP